MFSSGLADPDEQEARRYPVLIVGLERGVSRMLIAVCHALGSQCVAQNTCVEGLEYLARHRGPMLLILSTRPSADDDLSMFRYLSGNPVLRRRLGLIVYGGFDTTPRRRLPRRHQQLVSAWLSFPPSFETLQEGITAASLALTLRLNRRRRPGP